MRRRTLANLNGSSLNARPGSGRASIGGGRLSLEAGAAKAQKNRRYSVAAAPGGAQRAERKASVGAGSRGSVGSRKSSAGLRPSTGSGGRRVDPRPTSDRGFIQASVRAVINYLLDHDYGQPLTTKQLQRPSQRDFQNMVTFLFRQVDANLVPAGKCEDEVLQLCRGLHYPFTISKMSLQSVGSPHTWPHLLAFLSWLVELLNYDEAVADADEEELDKAAAGDAFDDELLAEKGFVLYLGQAYTAFLSGDDAVYEDLEEDLAARIAGPEETSKEALEAQNAALVEEIAAEERKASALPELQQRHADLASDKGKFLDLVAQLETYEANIANKASGREADLEKADAEVVALEAEINRITQRVAEQELSPEDVARMRSERQRLRDGRAAARESRDGATHRSDDARAALAQDVGALGEAAQGFSARIRVLGTEDLTVRMQREALTDAAVAPEALEEAIFTRDVGVALRGELSDLKDTIAKRRQAARQALLNAMDEDEKAQEALGELLDAASLLEGRVQRAEETYRRDKAQLEKTLAGLVHDTEEAEAAAHALRRPGDVAEQCAAARRRAAALARECEAETSRCSVEATTLHRRIFDCLSTVAEAKERTEKMVGELLDVYRAKAARLCDGV